MGGKGGELDESGAKLALGHGGESTTRTTTEQAVLRKGFAGQESR